MSVIGRLDDTYETACVIRLSEYGDMIGQRLMSRDEFIMALLHSSSFNGVLHRGIMVIIVFDGNLSSNEQIVEKAAFIGVALLREMCAEIDEAIDGKTGEIDHDN